MTIETLTEEEVDLKIERKVLLYLGQRGVALICPVIYTKQCTKKPLADEAKGTQPKMEYIYDN